MAEQRTPMTRGEILACVLSIGALYAIITACSNEIHIINSVNSNAPVTKSTNVTASVPLQPRLVSSKVESNQQALEMDLPWWVRATKAGLSPSPGVLCMALLGPVGSQVSCQILDLAGAPYVFGSNVFNQVLPIPSPHPELVSYLNTLRTPPSGFRWYVFGQPVTYAGLPNPITIETNFRLVYHCDPFSFSGPENTIYAFVGGERPTTWAQQGGDNVRFSIRFGMIPPVPALSVWGVVTVLGLLAFLGAHALIRRKTRAASSPIA
jgi:hypothetical protein